MEKLLAAALVAAVSLCAVEVMAQERSADEIIMCVDNYPPFHTQEPSTGRWVGESVDFAQAISEKLGVSLTFTEDTPFKRCLRKMQAGQVDLMTGLLYDEKRAEFMYLVRYVNSSQRVFLVRQNDVKIKRFEDLIGKQVGSILGHKYFPAFDAEDAPFTRHIARTLSSLIEMLHNGRISVAIVSEAHLSGLLNKQPDLLKGLKLAEYRYKGDNPVHVGISKLSPLAARIDEVRQVIAELGEEGVVEELYKRIRTEKPALLGQVLSQ